VFGLILLRVHISWKSCLQCVKLVSHACLTPLRFREAGRLIVRFLEAGRTKTKTLFARNGTHFDDFKRRDLGRNRNRRCIK